MSLALPTGRNGKVLALGLTVLVLALAWWGAVRPLIDWYGEQAETLAQRQAVALRMARVAATLPALRAQAEAAPASPTAVALLDGETDAIAAANLQERLQALAAAAGTSLTSVEMLPVERPAGEPANSDRAVRLRLTFDAPWATLVRLLDRMEAGPPLMLLDDLRLEGSRQLLHVADSPLQASLTVTGFRAPPGAASLAASPAASPAVNP
jgi:hypothetical protein